MGDTPFVVTHATYLATEADRIQSLILMPRLWGRKWTHKSLQKELEDIGLKYTLEQIAELNDVLHKRGIVEDLVTPGPAPVPVEAPVTVVVPETGVIVK